MAITIYKFAYHVDWNTTGIAKSGGRAGASLECDLSNYYTKTNLITPGEAVINSRNIFWSEVFGTAVTGGVAVVTGRLTRDGLIKSSADGVSSVIGRLALTYGEGLVPVDNILDWDAVNNWYAPYAARTAGGLYSGTTNPNGTTRLNWNGYFYATQLNVSTSGTAYSIYGYTSSNIALWGVADTGIALWAETTNSTGGNGTAIYAQSVNHMVVEILRENSSSNNTHKEILRIDCQWNRGQSGAANGIGGYISFYNTDSTGSLPEAGRLVFTTTDVTHNATDSAFEIWVKSANTMARKVKVSDIGQLILDTYGAGTHVGTATKLLGVDASGNVTEENIVGGASSPFQIGEADSLGNYDLDCTTYKDWIIEEISDDATINLNNTSNGDAGMLEVIIDSTGGYTVTLGTMFTKKMGPIDFDATAGADNIISWRKVGTSNIVYTIAQIEV